MDLAIETDSLGKRYGRTWALRDCSLQLPTGRVAALVGPNGAGKSTLPHLAVGLLRPDAGAVRIFGQPPQHNTGVLAQIGFVAQNTPLYPDFTAAELVMMGGSSTGVGIPPLPAAGWRRSESRLTGRSASSPVDSEHRSRSRSHWPSDLVFSFSTNRWQAWIPLPAVRSCSR